MVTEVPVILLKIVCDVMLAFNKFCIDVFFI